MPKKSELLHSCIPNLKIAKLLKLACFLVVREPFARQKQNLVVNKMIVFIIMMPVVPRGRAMWVIFGRALVYAHRRPLVGQQAATLAVGCWLAMTSFAATANLVEANNTSDEFSALRDYVQALS